MNRKGILLEALESTFDKMVEEKVQFLVNVGDGILRSYSDNSGQRSAYLTHHGYEVNSEKRKGRVPSYAVRRKLSFVNPIDVGKEDAVLMVISFDSIKTKAKIISISEREIKIDNISISINN